MNTGTFVGTILFADLSIYWHLPLLIFVISLVYSATRFDPWPQIMRETVRWVVRMSVFLLVIAVIQWVLSICI
jgi:hypothetical protein